MKPDLESKLKDTIELLEALKDELERWGDVDFYYWIKSIDDVLEKVKK